MAIVLTIVGVMVASVLTVVQQKTEADKYRLTLERMDAIESALMRYFERNRSLPCPASGAARYESETSGSWGAALTYATATSSCPNAPTDARGVPPVRTLLLPDETMYDGWGRKFSYQLSNGMGSQDDLYNQDNKGNLSVKNLQGFELTTLNFEGKYGAVYVLISHGRNGLRAWLPNVSGSDALTYIDTDIPTTDTLLGVEIENVDADTTFMQDLTAQDFDDILRFKTKSQIYADKRYVSPIRLSSRACESAREALTHATESWAAYTASTAVPTGSLTGKNKKDMILTAARALDKLCNGNVTPLTDECDSDANVTWQGPPSYGLSDCRCVTAGQRHKTDLEDAPLGGCE
jgi:type II secretory pathway pseudopilin PulG